MRFRHVNMLLEHSNTRPMHDYSLVCHYLERPQPFDLPLEHPYTPPAPAYALSARAGGINKLSSTAFFSSGGMTANSKQSFSNRLALR